MSSSAPVALVPLRLGGKTRLGASLAGPARAMLILAMLDDVVAALTGAGIADVRVLAGGEDAAAAARARGLTVLCDPPAPHRPSSGPGRAQDAVPDAALRRAVDAGLVAVGTGCLRLVVAADLPLLHADEVVQVLAHAALPRVVVAPTAAGGTGLLALPAGVVVPARYGAGSAAAHLALAAANGRSGSNPALELGLPGARRDVDGPEDLAAVARALAHPVRPQGGRATAAVLTAAQG
jgi:2-phospho-L-lactate/phosphoenolpyruvate guanylyltransferase